MTKQQQKMLFKRQFILFFRKSRLFVIYFIYRIYSSKHVSNITAVYLPNVFALPAINFAHI